MTSTCDRAVRAALASACALLLFSAVADAESLGTENPPVQTPVVAQPKRRFSAVKINEPITLDGRLDEPVWSRAQAADAFTQQEPDVGKPATERTEVKVLYDEKNLYIGIRAYDSHPELINARELRRDADFTNDDKVEILLDTNHDLRSAYRFAVNPLGTQQDALVTDEGRDINMAWNARWRSEARIDDKGWTAEIAIPLTSLRLHDGAPTWGFNVARRVRRKNEESLWTAWQRAFGLEKVSRAGELTGLELLKRPPVFEIKPYVTGGWRRGVPRVGSAGFLDGTFGTMGIEVARIGVTPSLTSEFTVNPDFGQVEADQQVVNLTRFPVFFPEKRDFFLENAGIFLFGDQGNDQLFFSRRMGLTNDGQPVPLNFGGKLTGKAGPFDVGYLQVQSRQIGDQSGTAGIPQQDFSVARVKYDVYERSYVGAMAVNRQGGQTSAYNRGGGFDAQLSLTDYWQLKGFVMGTENPFVKDSVGSSFGGSFFENDDYRLIGAFEEVGNHFNPETGFVERTGIRDYFGQAAYKPQPKWPHFVQQMEFETQEEYIQDRVGNLQTSQTELSWSTDFRDSSGFLFRPVEAVTDLMQQDFEIHPGIVVPAGRYHFNRMIASVHSDRGRRVVLSAREKWGDFYGGRRYETSASATFRPNEHLLLSLEDSYNRVYLPSGDFVTNLLDVRASYNFTRRWLTDVFVQANTDAQLTSVNARLRYLYRPDSDVFLIYNVATGRGLERPSNQLQLKITYYYGL
ncbi:MAG: carbohydrate binding family 9 domain-containing protein [Elusimicrobia bacterium]|nr:carbohydrate binding family 9 domain-containing protein [Elusimicrobiota bacterium]